MSAGRFNMLGRGRGNKADLFRRGDGLTDGAYPAHLHAKVQHRRNVLAAILPSSVTWVDSRTLAWHGWT